jgi:hypothetical protein
MYFAKPTSSFGYYRGAPVVGGDIGSQGPQMAGSNVFSQGQGADTNSSGSSWSPTLLYLFVLVLVEMFVFGIVARHI